MAKQPAAKNNDVATYLQTLQHPHKDLLLELREMILQTDKALTEQIKWNALSYGYNGEDCITFNLSGKGGIRLIFHRGAKKQAAPAERLIADDGGLLDWPANDRAVATIANADDLKQKKAQLQQIVRDWLDATR